MPIPERHKNMIDRLFKLTMQRKISWSPIQSNFLVANIADYSIRIGSPTRLGSTRAIRVTVHNSEGEVIDGFEELASAEHSLFRYLNSLYDVARRQAYGVDDALRRIDDELERLAATESEGIEEEPLAEDAPTVEDAQVEEVSDADPPPTSM